MRPAAAGSRGLPERSGIVSAVPVAAVAAVPAEEEPVTLEEALALVAGQRLGVLVTLRRNGRPQTSNVVYALRGRQVLVSLTDDRAKTRNLRRDARATLHVSTPDGSSWAALEGDATLSALTTAPGDETGRALADLYVAITGRDHPDWDEYHAAMVAERRLVLTVDVTHGYGGGAR